MAEELSEEDVFANDIDPLDAIREMRKAEGVSDETLETLKRDTPTDERITEDVVSDTDSQDADEEVELDRSEKQPLDSKSTGEEEDTDDSEEDSTETDTASDTSESDKQVGAEAGSESTGDEKSTTKTEQLTRKFKANGQDFEFTQDEINEQFETVFGQAMDYTKKMQKISPYRKMISALEQEGISQDQLNIAIDALKGDKGALHKIMEAHDIDSYDVSPDEESTPYQPNDYGKDNFQLEIEEVTSKIENDQEYAITVDVIDKQWDQHSREMIANNPSMIMGLHNDIKSGVYDQVAPTAMKMKVLDGNTKSDLEYYMLAGQQIGQQKTSSKDKVAELNKATQNADSEFEEASSEAKQKRSATSTRTRSDRKGVIDYLDDDDEAFDAWYKKLQASN